MEAMLELIELINSLATELFYDKTYIDGKELFQRGCCYELFLIINKIIPEAELLICKNKNHVAIKYEDTLYDSKGIIQNQNDYKTPTRYDYYFIEENFGLSYKHLHIKENIINEIETINIKDILEKFKQKKMIKKSSLT